MALCDLVAAATTLANLTDLCAVFSHCDTPPPTCAARPMLHPRAVASIQSAYGAFRAAFLHLGAAGGDGGDLSKVPLKQPLPQLFAAALPWALTSRSPGCGRRIDIVIRHCAQRPLLAAVGDLLTYVPAGACARVLVYANRTGDGRHVRPPRKDGGSPAVDARDALFSVERFQILPSFRGRGSSGDDELDVLLEAHRTRAAGLGDAGTSRSGVSADSTIFLSDARGLGDERLGEEGSGEVAAVAASSYETRAHYVDPWCRARALLSHEIGPPVVRLHERALALRLSTAQARNGSNSAKQWAAEINKWPTSRWSAEVLRCRQPQRLQGALSVRGIQQHQRLARVLAMLIGHVADLMQPAGSGVSVAAAAGSSNHDVGASSGCETSTTPRAGSHRLASRGNVSSRIGALASLRPPRLSVSLACLEPDFFDHNRELLPRGAAAAHAACDPALIVYSAHLASELHAEIHLIQHGSEAPVCLSAMTGEAKPAQLRREATEQLVAVSLHPSGFFSLLHGLIKPLMYTLRTRRVLLTPRVLEFTSEDFPPSPCQARDLTCFFLPLSPPCDEAERISGDRKSKAKAAATGKGRAGSVKHGWHTLGGRPWPALAKAKLPARGEKFTEGEARAASRTPARYRSRGWFWWSSHLLGYLLRPNIALRSAVQAASVESKLHIAIEAGSLIIGIHVRHGDACRKEEILRARRSCTPLSEYMSAASRLLAEASHRPGCSTRATIYLATDSIQVLRESAAYAHEFDIFHLSERLVTRHNPRDGQALLWDRRIWQRYYWGQTAWTMRQAWQASVELLLLAHADAFRRQVHVEFLSRGLRAARGAVRLRTALQLAGRPDLFRLWCARWPQLGVSR